MKKILSALVLAGMASQAQAGLLNLNFNGVISSMPASSHSPGATAPTQGSIFSVGDAFSISLSYKDAAESNCSKSGALSFYCGSSAVSGTLTVGNRKFNLTNDASQLARFDNSHSVQAFPAGKVKKPSRLFGNATMAQSSKVQGNVWTSFGFNLPNTPDYTVNATGDAAVLNGQEIKEAKPLWQTIDLSKYDLQYLLVGTEVPVNQHSNKNFYYAYNLGEFVTDMSLSTAPVPLPAAAWLFLSGLVGLVGISRKARKAA